MKGLFYISLLLFVSSCRYSIDDIFIRTKAEGTVTDYFTGVPIEGATVDLIEISPEGEYHASSQAIQQVYTNEEGAFTFKKYHAKRKLGYAVWAKKDGYYNPESPREEYGGVGDKKRNENIKLQLKATGWVKVMLSDENLYNTNSIKLAATEEKLFIVTGEDASIYGIELSQGFDEAIFWHKTYSVIDTTFNVYIRTFANNKFVLRVDNTIEEYSVEVDVFQNDTCTVTIKI